jgi:hypothetical protein
LDYSGSITKPASVAERLAAAIEFAEVWFCCHFTTTIIHGAAILLIPALNGS